MSANTEIKIIQNTTFDTIKSAVNKMVDFIKPTYGPASNKVIISTPLNHEVVDDGHRIAAQFELADPSENAVVKEIRQVSSKTDDRVGDGTTGSLIILQAIINEVAKKSRWEGHKIIAELKRGLDEAKKQLLKSATKIKTKEELKKVARTSFDNEQIAEMIADLYFKLGKNGVVEVAKSQSLETTVEMSEGIKIERGYLSQYMITNPERMESVIEKPHFLITDYRITEHSDILPLLEKMAAANKRELVIICDNLEHSALATVVANRLKGAFLAVAINIPFASGSQGRTIWLEDIALLTGGKVFSSSKGDKLELAEIEDLGKANQFICRQKESIIIDPKGDKLVIKSAVASLQSALTLEKDQGKKDDLARRLGIFTNSLATIKVGALTESEQKALLRKIEDAIHSTKLAYRGGVVCGAGFALARLKTSSPILNEALRYPAKQLFENVGIDSDWQKSYLKDAVLNVVTMKEGHFMDVGVIDPVETLIAGVESAVSIASNLLTTSGIYAESPKKPPIENQ